MPASSRNRLDQSIARVGGLVCLALIFVSLLPASKGALSGVVVNQSKAPISGVTSSLLSGQPPRASHKEPCSGRILAQTPCWRLSPHCWKPLTSRVFLRISNLLKDVLMAGESYAAEFPSRERFTRQKFTDAQENVIVDDGKENSSHSRRDSEEEKASAIRTTNRDAPARILHGDQRLILRPQTKPDRREMRPTAGGIGFPEYDR